MSSHKRASLLARNLLNEFADPRRINYALAQYYTGLEPGIEDPEDFSDEQSLISWKDKEQKYVLTQNGSVFEIFSKGKRGMIVETSVDGSMTLRAAAAATDGLLSMAIRDDRARVVVAIVNNHSPAAREIDVNFMDLKGAPETARATIQLVDERHGHNGLDAGETRVIERECDGSFRVGIKLSAHATACISLSFAKTDVSISPVPI